MKYNEAKAVFSWVSDNMSGEVVVNGNRNEARDDDDWKVNLAVEAVDKIAVNNNVDARSIELSLVELQTTETLFF